MYEQSHRDLAWLSASLSACHGLLIITVITPLPTKPSATKCQRTEVTNAAITDMQMRQRDVAALDAKYTKELADAKAENDALRDDAAAGRRRLHIKAVCQSVREATIASGVDKQCSLPRLAERTPLNGLFPTRERLTTMQKQLEGTQKYINVSGEIELPISMGKSGAIIVSNTHALQRSINA